MKTAAQRKKEQLARAQEIADGLKRGEYVAEIGRPKDTWFPEKAKIKKDKKEIERTLNPKAP